MLPIPYLFLAIALFFCLAPPFQSLGAQDTIYLPFPDLPREIIQPESPEREILRSSGNRETNSNTPLPSKTFLPPRDSRDSRDSGTSIDTGNARDSKDSIDTGNAGDPKDSRDSENARDPRNSRDSGASRDSRDYSESKNSRKTQTVADKEATTKTTKTNNQTKPLEKDTESDILNPSDLVEFRKAMASIRKKESGDRNYAEKEYKKLAEKYSHPYFRGKILISLAWNYFHRRENLKTLQTVIRILEDKSLLEMDEYPTAMYLAYRIHGRPWEGKNENFQNKYKEIFRKNLESGRENFQKSLYKSEFR